MNKSKGYVVRLNEQREEAFENNDYESFGEPVPEFNHSRNIPLICFVINSRNILTHVALGKRGYLAGTDVRRLNLNDIFELTSIVKINELVDSSPNRIKKNVNEKMWNGGLISPKSFEFLLNKISKLAPETASILSKYSEARIKRIKSLPSKVKDILAEQKEAVATAMTIAGVDRVELQGWDVTENEAPTSFLDGLEQVRLREDPMVINDLATLPGYKILKTTPFNSVVFENNKSKLTVVLANRLPLEQQLGVDLIYYNETFSCFLMIQYKAMEKEGDDAVYRFPNIQLTEEISRMDGVLSELKKIPSNSEVDGFRLNESPFFLKMCPRIVFNPDNIGLIKGMYLPLEYWKLLSTHPTMVGPKGGRRLSYKNVRRYFDNTEFVTMASGGWVGSNISQSRLLEKAIRSTLESGRSVVFAVNNEKDNRHRCDD
ncbi:Putative uncharacterized protein [Moritella viscosa]|uniref:RlpA-like double-psi beta-barrel domain-containing protein n=1 Tax=Moritella viscosa TaxID=80854 RepID=UPI0009131666|nr:RlpA-like double-psi beta-barrel domain-containing protein [Moritella viscosa]SGZ08061.1 Putative uncharacterized protein [Moritella viscosa]